MARLILIATILLFQIEIIAEQPSSFDHSHSAWTEILQKNVVVLRDGRASAVKYKSIDKAALDKYINSLLSVNQLKFDAWTKDQQLAYYFNLYNALTVQIVLKHYPIKSIKDIGSLFRSTWKKKFFTLFGKESYLDRIEHELVRGSGKYRESRVHFAFNCASIGCPALLNKAFTAQDLDKQLEEATVNFLRDNKRNYYNAKKKSLYVSKIFDWYDEDFEKGWNGHKSLKGFFAKYAEHLSEDSAVQKMIREKKVKIRHNDYDWGLNITE